MATQTQATIQIPLDIPNVKVVRTEIHPDEKLLIWVESQVETVPCGICGRELRATFGHGQEIRLRHLPVLGMETYICIRPRRARCCVCATEPTTTQVLEWYDQRSPHTKAYDRYLLKQLVNSTIEEVSLSENVGYDAIVGALNRQIDTQVDWEQVDDLSTVGIDEIAMSKGRKNYAAIITTRQKDGKVRILAVLPDRKKQQ
jgi:transposase